MDVQHGIRREKGGNRKRFGICKKSGEPESSEQRYEKSGGETGTIRDTGGPTRGTKRVKTVPPRGNEKRTPDWVNGITLHRREIDNSLRSEAREKKSKTGRAWKVGAHLTYKRRQGARDGKEKK